jgi:hypothetical protein
LLLHTISQRDKRNDKINTLKQKILNKIVDGKRGEQKKYGIKRYK